MMKTRTIFIACLFLTTFEIASFSQLKIITGGNVGIGTDTPVEKLQINGSVRGDQSGALKINTGNGYITVGPTNTSFAHFTTALTRFYFNKMIILGDGKLSSYSTNDLLLCTGHSSPSTRMTICAGSGNVLIGTIYDSNAKLNVGGDIAIFGTIKVTSDIRFKENIKIMDESFNKIALLQPITYNYTSALHKATSVAGDSTKINDAELRVEDAFTKKVRYGFSAQDLQKVFPELVSEDVNGYLSIDYNGLIPVLVEAMKEQQLRISELEKKIQKLSGGKTSL